MPLQLLAYYLTYYVAAESTKFPNVDRIQTIHFWITASLIVLSVVYLIPAIYNRSQKMQYFLSIISVQNIGAGFCYLIALFFIGEQTTVTKASLLTFTIVTLGFGALIFIATSIRFYTLLRKGDYREGSKKSETREKFEAKSYLPIAIIGSTGLIFVSQYVVRMFDLMEIEIMFVIIGFIMVFFTMIFILPEQLVILYCKFRYKSFNFDRRGYMEEED